MEFILRDWLEEITKKLKLCFENRLLFAGYQGSYRRGEASDNSDVDMVVILDELDFDDLIKYKKIVKSMPFSNKACGFISGKSELLNWAKHELFQLLHDTEPLCGDLNSLITVTSDDAYKAVKLNTQSLYHLSVHSFLYDEDKKTSLTALYKPVFFILQAKYYAENNEFISNKLLLSEKLSGLDKQVTDICISRENISEYTDDEADNLYKILINWCAEQIKD